MVYRVWRESPRLDYCNYVAVDLVCVHTVEHTWRREYPVTTNEDEATRVFSANRHNIIFTDMNKNILKTWCHLYNGLARPADYSIFALEWTDPCEGGITKTSKIILKYRIHSLYANSNMIQHDCVDVSVTDVELSVFNPLIAILKPHSNGSLYSNTLTFILAVDGWAATFGTARRRLGGLGTRLVRSSLYQM